MSAPRRSRRGLPAPGLAALVALLLAAAPGARAADEATLTVAVSGAGEVAIAPAGITCDSTCTAAVVPGTEVTLEATPSDGFVLAAWHGACAGTEGATCVLEPGDDAAVTAVFAAASTTTATTDTSAPTTTGTPMPTVTAPPQPVVPAPTDPGQAVAEAVSALPVATVAFTTPPTLGLEETATIQLLLSPTTRSIGALKKRLSEAGEKSGARVKYSSTMEARLEGEDFEITPVDSPRKLVASDRDTEWLWQVKPKRTGELRLFLTLYAIVDVAGERGPYKIRTFRHTLAIEVTWTTRARHFVEDNWQWLWTAVVVPVGLWAFRRRSKRDDPAGPDAATHH